MKKLLISLAMIMMVLQVSAQSKDAVEAVKKVTKANAEVANPKKATNPKSWMNVGHAYSEAYDAPIKGLYTGSNNMEVHLLFKDQQVLESKEVEMNGKMFLKEVYADKELFYDESGKLVAWNVVKPALENEDPLLKAFEAYTKSAELDPKAAANKDLKASFDALKSRYYNEAMCGYYLGVYDKASDNFLMAAKVSESPVVGAVDTTLYYYTAITGTMCKKYDRAIENLNKCISLNFEQDGDVYAQLADAYKQSADTTKAKETLNAGFVKFPTSQSILVALINIYMESNDDPAKLRDLLHTAQANEPNNPSLYYAEGNVLVKLGQLEEAMASYKKSVEIDPKYFWGYFSQGKSYYDKAVEIQNEANMEADDAKYAVLLEKLDGCLKSAIEPLEQSFSLTQDPELQSYVAELLKNIYFRFRDKDDACKAGYEKYNAFLAK